MDLLLESVKPEAYKSVAQLIGNIRINYSKTSYISAETVFLVAVHFFLKDAVD